MDRWVGYHIPNTDIVSSNSDHIFVSSWDFLYSIETAIYHSTLHPSLWSQKLIVTSYLTNGHAIAFHNTLLNTYNLKKAWFLALTVEHHQATPHLQFTSQIIIQNETEKLQYWYHYVRTYIDSCFPNSLFSFFKGVWSNEIMNNYDFNHMNIFNKRPNCVLTSDKSPCCCNWAQGFNYTSVKLKQRGQNENTFIFHG